MIAIAERIANELNVNTQQVTAAVALLDEGATVPFISRYRKEVTGGLDDGQMRLLLERLGYLRELESRRDAIIKLIDEQDKLTPALKKDILEADSKTRLEDLYLPFKQKRRTKGQIAIEAGIEPLAEALLQDPSLDPEVEAAKYINDSADFKQAFEATKGVLDGAKYILMERFAEDADLLADIRQYMGDQGELKSTVVPGKEQEAAKFSDYFDNTDQLKKMPSHRVLAMLRGRNEGFLQLKVDAPDDGSDTHPCEFKIAKRNGIQSQGRKADDWLNEVVRWTWKIKLQLKMETELLAEIRQAAEVEAIHVFGQNLKDLLLAAPAGQKATMGLDPGLRTGVKVAVIDSTGKYLDSMAIFPHQPRNQWDESIALLAKMAAKHNVNLLAIGNGTASRETDRLCAELIKKHPDLGLQKIMVSEAGASVYSASEIAAAEFPELDVTIRGAISIARRLQDPLAELVKIDPKSIGVGQYQHDVNQTQLAKNLDSVVEDCVNSVGVEANTASAAVLSHVAGLNKTIAHNIVAYRDENGAFTNRKQLKKVPRLGEKAFEQAAGFIRIRNSDNPLDASAVHPESYSVVQRMLADTQCDIKQLLGNKQNLSKLQAEKYIDEKFGLPTVTDIISELDKPGRDPRPEFKAAVFKEGVEKVSDLKPGMILEGTVSNVTHFGAFVDIGVHQDGLVHISAMSDKFIKDPHEVVKAGEIVKVKVMEVDLERKRIALSLRLDDPLESEAMTSKKSGQNKPNQNKSSRTHSNKPKRQGSGQSSQGSGSNNAPVNNAFAEAFANAKKGK
ncbi:Tex family protein [Leucothrix pacifica]|uniref:RNA-binding transcriptional accessory protein n=1 Tax=Leucothrix pacifica TaxID=1247513 RepID=A0A317C8P8_9GAMM|nr:Tex family protein [Leucothrix pacifica]PWQ94926.1 RNA-binding transcriptional accessory protein [Leucothrix pacifica]